MAIHKGRIIHQYLDDWLVKATSHRGCLRHTLENMPKFRLPVRPHGRSDPTYTGPLAEPSGQNTRNTVPTGLSGPAVHV